MGDPDCEEEAAGREMIKGEFGDDSGGSLEEVGGR